MEIFKLFGSVLVDNDKANKSISDTEKKGQGLGTTLGKIGGIALKAGAVLGTAFVAGGAALMGIATKSAEATDRIDKMSQKIGISRQSFQEWDFILSQNGASVDGLQMGLKTLSKAADEAAQGTKTYTETFDRLGISVKDGNGNLKSQEVLFNETVLALSKMENETERTALASQLLGKSATELSPMLNSGAESVENLRAKAHELGLVLDDDAVNSGVVFTDTMDQVKRSLGAAATSIGVTVMPMIQKGLDWVIVHMPEIKEITGKVFEFIGVSVSKTIDWIGKLIEWAKQWYAENKETLTAIYNAFSELFTTVWEMISAFIAVIMAIWNEYGEEIMMVLSAIWDTVKTIFEVAFKLIVDIFRIFAALFRGDWAGLWEGIKKYFYDVFDGIGKIFGKWVEYIKAAFTLIGSIVGDIWAGIWDGIVNIAKNAVNGVITTINGMVKSIVSGVNAIISGINKVSGVNLPTITAPQIPYLAEGGDIIRGGRVIVGERGPEELSLPTGAKVKPLDSAEGERGDQYITIERVEINADNVDSFNRVVEMLSNLKQVQRQGAY